MTNTPHDQLQAVFHRHQEDSDPLRLFTELYAIIRPRRASIPQSAVNAHAALVELLASDPRCRRQASSAFAHLLSSRNLVGFFADSGILPQTGFFAELLRIASHRLLPELPDEREFRDCLHLVFHRQDDWVWLSAIPVEDSQRLWSLLKPEDELGRHEIAHIFDQLVEAMLVLAYRISGIDVDREFARLGDGLNGHAQAFRAIAGEAQRFADAWRAASQAGHTPVEDERHLLVLVDQCEQVLQRAHRAAMRYGTSLALTTLLHRAGQRLQRLKAIAILLGAQRERSEAANAAASASWNELTREALRAENQRNSLRRHVARGMSLLALRVTDNAAKSGEHYVTETREAYWSMWRAAMGAGVIIALLALLKIFVSGIELPLAGYAFFYSLIYGLGFVLIYMLHLTIATKQPAMTAQTIASYLGEIRQGGREDLERMVDLIAAVSRSQVAAIVGNVAVALPVAMAIGFVWQQAAGTPMLDAGKGAHLLDDLDPLGWALPHAAIAGVFLFFSGIISGYFDNLASHARIGERIARLRWLSLFAGSHGADRIGAYIDTHLGGLAGNFLFGCMLGSTGIIGIIFGLPLDIRHIAFSSANLGYALSAFDFVLPAATLLWAALGVLLIGGVNLAVSFSLALWMALRARAIAFTQTGELLRALGRRLRAAPATFLAAPPGGP